MTVARAARYPQPPPLADVLAADRCDHGAVTGRCPLCRLAADHADGQAGTPEWPVATEQTPEDR